MDNTSPLNYQKIAAKCINDVIVPHSVLMNHFEWFMREFEVQRQIFNFDQCDNRAFSTGSEHFCIRLNIILAGIAARYNLAIVNVNFNGCIYLPLKFFGGKRFIYVVPNYVNYWFKLGTVKNGQIERVFYPETEHDENMRKIKIYFKSGETYRLHKLKSGELELKPRHNMLETYLELCWNRSKSN